MSLIDAARRLADPEEDDGGVDVHADGEFLFRQCRYCAASYSYGEAHSPDCPWLQVPSIVAALEAGERMAEVQQRQEYPGYWGAMRKAADAFRAALTTDPKRI